MLESQNKETDLTIESVQRDLEIYGSFELPIKQKKFIVDNRDSFTPSVVSQVKSDLENLDVHNLKKTMLNQEDEQEGVKISIMKIIKQKISFKK